MPTPFPSIPSRLAPWAGAFNTPQQASFILTSCSARSCPPGSWPKVTKAQQPRRIYSVRRTFLVFSTKCSIRLPCREIVRQIQALFAWRAAPVSPATGAYCQARNRSRLTSWPFALCGRGPNRKSRQLWKQFRVKVIDAPASACHTRKINALTRNRGTETRLWFSAHEVVACLVCDGVLLDYAKATNTSRVKFAASLAGSIQARDLALRIGL